MAAALGIGLGSPARRIPSIDVDNYGNADVYWGHIEGDRLVFESMAGTGTRLRLTWNATEATVIKWRNEMTTSDGSWFLIEEYPMVPG